MTSVHDVAAYILEQTGSALSTMKLQKLTYLAQGWSLGILSEPMFPEDFQAWRNGPVSLDLYRDHRGAYSVDAWGKGQPSNLTAVQRAVVDGTLSNYGALSGLELSELTHQPGSPWSETRLKLALDPSASSKAVIDKALIKAHYEELLALPR